VRTPLGDLLFHLAYGCGVHRLIGRVTGGTAAQLGSQYVRGALLADPRVSNVESVQATPSGDVLPVAATINPIVGAPIEVTL
jgi:phage baseplate assembly protein W